MGMAGKLNLKFGIIGWCRQDSLAGENFPTMALKIFWWVSKKNSTLVTFGKFYVNTFCLLFSLEI